MLIAFEGPDRVGKSTMSKRFHHNMEPTYNLTREIYNDWKDSSEHVVEHLPLVADRIDWLTHLIYRTTLTKFEWNDARVRTVFAAPEMHLVVMTHKDKAGMQDELYIPEDLDKVNKSYLYWTEFLTGLNEHMGFNLFKSITTVQVNNTLGNAYEMQAVHHSSPALHISGNDSLNISTPHDLMDFLERVDKSVNSRG